MSDKIRTSTFIKDKVYEGVYDKSVSTKDQDQCMDMCLSSKDCVGWKYSGGACSLAASLDGKMTDDKGFYSGKIELKNYFSFVNLLVFVLFAAFLSLALLRLLKATY